MVCAMAHAWCHKTKQFRSVWEANGEGPCNFTVNDLAGYVEEPEFANLAPDLTARAFEKLQWLRALSPWAIPWDISCRSSLQALNELLRFWSRERKIVTKHATKLSTKLFTKLRRKLWRKLRAKLSTILGENFYVSKQDKKVFTEFRGQFRGEFCGRFRGRFCVVSWVGGSKTA